MSSLKTFLHICSLVHQILNSEIHSIVLIEILSASQVSYVDCQIKRMRFGIKLPFFFHAFCLHSQIPLKMSLFCHWLCREQASSASGKATSGMSSDEKNQVPFPLLPFKSINFEKKGQNLH